MSPKPRVTARSEVEGMELQAADGHRIGLPAALVEVSFDLHDHAGALAALDRAVADVKAQIEEAT